MKNMKIKLKIVLEPSRNGGYAVHVPALRGCHTQGESVKEALENAKDAIKTYLRTSQARLASVVGIFEDKVFVFGLKVLW